MNATIFRRTNHAFHVAGLPATTLRDDGSDTRTIPVRAACMIAQRAGRMSKEIDHRKSALTSDGLVNYLRRPQSNCHSHMALTESKAWKPMSPIVFEQLTKQSERGDEKCVRSRTRTWATLEGTRPNPRQKWRHRMQAKKAERQEKQQQQQQQQQQGVSSNRGGVSSEVEFFSQA